MDKKYRVNELAKDLNIPVSEITDVVQEYFGVQKKSQASLSEDEMSVVLEKYSQSNQVKNFNSYFASASKPKTEKKEEKPAEKPAKKAEKKPEPNKEADKAEKVQAKPETKTEAKPEAKPEIKTETKSEAKPEIKAESKPEAKSDKPADKKPMGDRNDRKPYGDKQQGDRKPYGARRNDTRNDRRDTKPAQQTAPAQPVIDLANIKTNAPPTKHVKGEAVQRGEQVTKHVDTRGSYVNLDKYNEKYETIASTESGNRRQNDAYTKKQKSQKGKQQFSKKKVTEAQKL